MKQQPSAIRGKDGPLHSFIAELIDTPQGDECVTWPFGRNRNGYGKIWIDGRHRVVSRHVCELFHGAPPTPLHHAAHSCGKGHEGCVNPRHLRWATASENSNDRFLHGTARRGERPGFGKLTKDQVRDAIARRKAGETNRAIAEDFGVSRSTISMIATGRNWAWLQQEASR